MLWALCALAVVGPVWGETHVVELKLIDTDTVNPSFEWSENILNTLSVRHGDTIVFVNTQTPNYIGGKLEYAFTDTEKSCTELESNSDFKTILENWGSSYNYNFPVDTSFLGTHFIYARHTPALGFPTFTCDIPALTARIQSSPATTTTASTIGATATLHTVYINDLDQQLFDQRARHAGQTPVLDQNFLEVYEGDRVRFKALSLNQTLLNGVGLYNVTLDDEYTPECNPPNSEQIIPLGVGYEWVVGKSNSEPLPELVVMALDIPNIDHDCINQQAVFLVHSRGAGEHGATLKVVNSDPQHNPTTLVFISGFQGGITINQGETFSLTTTNAYHNVQVRIFYSQTKSQCDEILESLYETVNYFTTLSQWTLDESNPKYAPGTLYFYAWTENGLGQGTARTCDTPDIEGKLTIIATGNTTSSTTATTVHLGATQPTITTNPDSIQPTAGSSTTTTQAEESSDDLSTGAIVGIAVGSGLAVIVFAVFIVYRMRGTRPSPDRYWQ